MTSEMGDVVANNSLFSGAHVEVTQGQRVWLSSEWWGCSTPTVIATETVDTEAERPCIVIHESLASWCGDGSSDSEPSASSFCTTASAPRC